MTAPATARPGLAATAPIVVIAVFGVTFGITYPLLALLLEQRGLPSGVIGVNSAMTPLGMVLSAPLIPRLLRVCSPWRAMVTALVAIAVLIAVLAVCDDLALWFVVRFAVGSCAVTMFVLGETWISEAAAGPRRGRLLTAYTSVMALGFALGPAVMAVSGPGSPVPLAVAVAGPLLAVVPLWVARAQVPRMVSSGPIPVRSLVTRLSVLLVPVLSVSVFDGVTPQFLPGYMLSEGLSPRLAALSLTVVLAGQVLFQYPLGRLADRMNPRSALVLSLSAGAAGALALPWAVGVPWLFWPLVAVWGGLAFAGYPLVLTILGEGLEGSSLLLGNTAFAIVWGLGGIAGPPCSGVAIDWLGPAGMPLSLATLWLPALAVIAVARLRDPGTVGPHR
ncbi:MFS transporter [Amycolatopsis sp. NPDC021455]|uniref:MFS transporter n=1 Tax=Amycolatopsis sp. NPDC021455 TaxID=3154901 RepID=UPI0033D97D88